MKKTSKINILINKIVNFGVDQNLLDLELRKVKLLNVIVFCISAILIVFLAINLVQRNYFLAITDIILFLAVCVPSWILQYKKKYNANLIMITSAFFICTTVVTILEYDVNRQTEHILPAIAIMTIFLFDGWKRYLMFILFPISFFTIRFVIMYQTDGIIKLEALHLIFLIEFIIVYVIASFFKADMLNFYRRLRESNDTKNKLFRIISHDLRSPFSSLLGTSELQSKFIENNDLEKIKMSSEIINSSSRKIFELTQSLLDWSQTQTETFIAHKEKQNIADLIKQTVEFCEITARTKNITIEYETNGLVFLNCDKVMTQISVRNIIMNAVKFSHRNSTIKVFLEEKKDSFCIKVLDSGIGMSKETCNNLFDESKIQSTYGTEKEKGSGLGLLICKELIEKQSGIIKITSKKDTGSEFVICLPKK